MIKFERTSVMNFENAMRGARNPMNSWGRMDSSYDEDGNFVFWTERSRSCEASPHGWKRPQKVYPPDLCIRGYYGSALLVEGI